VAGRWRADRWTAARRAVLTLLAVGVVALGVSGVCLTWTYAPGPTGPELARDVHRVSAVLTTILLALLTALLIAERIRHRMTTRRVAAPPWRWLTASVGGVAAATAGLLTGPRLAWDQLALWAVTVVDPPDYRGLRGPWGDIRFVIVDGREVSPGSYKTWAIVHVVVLPLLVLLLAAVIAGRRSVGWHRLPRKRVVAGSAASARPAGADVLEA
jgi:hypothetical protein